MSLLALLVEPRNIITLGQSLNLNRDCMQPKMNIGLLNMVNMYGYLHRPSVPVSVPVVVPPRDPNMSISVLPPRDVLVPVVSLVPVDASVQIIRLIRQNVNLTRPV